MVIVRQIYFHLDNIILCTLVKFLEIYFKHKLIFITRPLLGIYSQTNQKHKIEIRMKQNRNELGVWHF